MKLYETSLPMNYSKGLFEEKVMDLAPEHTDKYAFVIFTATSNLLNASKSMDHPTCLEFTDVDGSFVAAAIVEYFPNEDPSKPGNWSLVWTFNEKDIPTNCNRISFNNEMTHSYFRAAAGDKYGMSFKNTECLIIPSVYLLQQIRKWLDENAEEGKEVLIEQDAVWQARVAIENGEKVFALEPKGEIKQLIKDDSSIQK